jgi:hypothetical protein
MQDFVDDELDILREWGICYLKHGYAAPGSHELLQKLRGRTTRLAASNVVSINSRRVLTPDNCDFEAFFLCFTDERTFLEEEAAALKERENRFAKVFSPKEARTYYGGIRQGQLLLGSMLGFEQN